MERASSRKVTSVTDTKYDYLMTQFTFLEKECESERKVMMENGLTRIGGFPTQ